jgi:superfamily II DNA/RNA helicase
VLIRNLAKEELGEENRKDEVSLAIKAIVLAPTREIAIQA